MRLEYPHTMTVDQVDVYHGREIRDPYRWLEDLSSPQTRQWIAAQNELTESFLKEIPLRERIRRRLAELWNYDRFGVPVVRGERYFYLRHSGMRAQPALHVTREPHDEGRVLLDPNTWSDEGTVALSSFVPSTDGRLVAFSRSEAGSDWLEWHVLDVDSGLELGDVLRWSKFAAAAWAPDSSGFFYTRYDEPSGPQDVNRAQRLCFHRLGTPQSGDELVYDNPGCPDWMYHPTVTDDGQWLVVIVSKDTGSTNAVLYRAISEGAMHTMEDRFDALYAFAGNDRSRLFFHTDLDAPRGRILEIDATSRERREIVATTSDALTAARVAGGRLVAHYLTDARSSLRIFGLDGGLEHDIDLPGIGTVAGIEARHNSPEIFYWFTGFTMPATVYRCDVRTGRSDIFRRPELPFDTSGFETRQIFYESKDGTRVPMFVSHRTGIELDGRNPTFLYGYGGFNHAMTPVFSVLRFAWMEMGGVVAVAGVRGGWEYGEEWHLAGTKLRKQNVFDDFFAGAEKLVSSGYTSTDRLAIAGGSNGGLLVGACITQRPERFGAAHIAVGVLDMLRFDKFTIGWAWVSDYGSPGDPEEFEALLAYSPLHNVRPAAYPPTIITTGDHDDRVWPGHSFKFASALHAAQLGPAPVLIRVETRAGHGMGKPMWMLVEESADVLSFLARALRWEPPVG